MNRWWKRVWILTMVFLLVSGMIPPAARADMVDTSDNEVIRQKSVSKGKIGKSMNLSVEVWNQDGSDWNDVVVRVINVDSGYMAKPGESDTAYVYPFEQVSDGVRVGTVPAGGHKSVSIPVKVRADLTEGYYIVHVEARSISGDREEYLGEDTVNIWVTKPTGADDEEEKADKQINFVLGEGNTTPYAIYPNVMNFAVNMRNAGLSDALDVTVQTVLDKDTENFPFDINEGNYDRTFEKVAPGEVVQLPYSFAIREEAYTGFYPIKFNITYRESATGDLKTQESSFWVRVKNKERPGTQTEFDKNSNTMARIVVDSYETIPEDIIAGEPFKLLLRMKNASSDIDASNIQFTLKSETSGGTSGGGGAVFTTQSGSSSYVVNSLRAGEVTELDLDMQSLAGIDQRTYSLEIEALYDSPDYKNATATSTINIPVRQIARLNTGTIEVMPDSIEVGSESNIMFPINNTGKVILYNVMVAFEADSINPADTYVGNLEPGKTGNVDVMLTGAAGTMDDGKVKIKITYEDEYGVVQDPVEKELTLYVTEPIPYEEPETEAAETVEENPAGISSYLVYIVAAAALVAVITVIVLVVKKKKKKKASEEEFEDEIS